MWTLSHNPGQAFDVHVRDASQRLSHHVKDLEEVTAMMEVLRQVIVISSWSMNG